MTLEASLGQTNPPLVSIVVPTYNCAAFIGEALDSVYRQSHDHWEVIVVDDGSTDGTRAALTPHMGRIRYIHQANRGASNARNHGVKQARGELIAFLDADDIWLPDKLALQARVMRESPDCGLVFCDGEAFTSAGTLFPSVLTRRIQSWADAHETGDPHVFKGNLLREMFFGNHICSASSVMVRRKWLEDAGGFDEKLVIGEDYDVWFELAKRGPVALVRQRLFRYRWHDGSVSGPMSDRDYRWKEASFVVIERHLSEAPADLLPDVRKLLTSGYWQCARYYFRLDQFREARRMLWGCLRHNKRFVPALLFLGASGLGRPVVHAARKTHLGLRRLLRRLAV